MAFSLDNYNQVRRTKVMLFGPPKSGKTRLAGALANAGFILHWFDMEQGIKTLMQHSAVLPQNRKNIKLYNIPDHKDYPIAIDAMRALFKPGKKKFCYLHGSHVCPSCSKDPNAIWSDEIDITKLEDNEILVLDSWTQVANSAGNKATLKAVRNDPDYKADFDDWRLQGAYQEEILSKIQVSNTNICVISHELDVEKDEKKEKIAPNSGTRNFSKVCAKYFDEVIYMQVLNKSHRAYSSSTFSNNHITGGRSGIVLEDDKDNISLEKIFRPAKT